jgi:hypothetical protein
MNDRQRGNGGQGRGSQPVAILNLVHINKKWQYFVNNNSTDDISMRNRRAHIQISIHVSDEDNKGLLLRCYVTYYLYC